MWWNQVLNSFNYVWDTLTKFVYEHIIACLNLSNILY